MKSLRINTASKKYKIYIGNNIIGKLSKIIKKENIDFKKVLIIVDKNVPKIFAKKIKSNILAEQKIIYYFSASEKKKNFNVVGSILQMLLKNNFTRNDAIICLGGGIAGDVSGFAASIYKRGLKFINMPSTLLSQVDSSIGGKTGINNKFGKNLIGSFYQPDLVISDTKLLKSLSRREIICGYAEILKHSLIKNKKLFLFLDRNIKGILNLNDYFIKKAILESCKIKKSVVEKDENEKSVRKILNLGHTFGHAYEATLNFSNKLNHGEAVLLGILSAIKLSKKLGQINTVEYDLILSHLSKLKFDKINKFFKINDLNKIIKFMITDKKNTTNKINFITLKRIGSVNINNQLKLSKVKEFIKSELIK